MTDTDMLHMAALEARLTEAEEMLDRAEMLLWRARLLTDNDVAEASQLQRKIRNFLGEEE